MKGKTIIKCEYESVTSDNYYNEDQNNEKAGFIVSKKQMMDIDMDILIIEVLKL